MDDLFSVGQALDAADDALTEGRRAAADVFPTGLELLDRCLGGGLRGGELTLLGGPPGLGKTALALQIARNVVAAGGAAVVMSYEHGVMTLLERLIAIESADLLGLDGVPLRRVREALESTGATLEERLTSSPGGAEAVVALRGYGDRLLLHESFGSATGLAEIRTALRTAADRSGVTPVLVVDYLQKVSGEFEDARGLHGGSSVSGLRQLALESGAPVLAVVAADPAAAGPGRRLRVAHLQGPAALGYEPDVILIMNEKVDIVARRHLLYDSRAADRFRDHVVLTIEKNRSGLAGIDLELRKRLEQSWFEPDARLVAEDLLDERLPSD